MQSILLALLLCAAGLVSQPASRGGELRNVKVGQEMPHFSMTTLEDKTLTSEELAGKVTIIVYVAARQAGSEAAAVEASEVFKSFHCERVHLIYASADTEQAQYFRNHRDRTRINHPFVLDADRTLYGKLGLIVLPTTIVVDADWKLAQVISSHKSDYSHVLTQYVLHALDEIDDAQLEERLQAGAFERSRPEDRIARHRSAAEVLRRNRLYNDAETELRNALSIDPEHSGASLDLASLYIVMERIDDAQKIVADVLESTPGDRRAVLLSGIILYHQDKLDEAQAILERSLLLNPDPVYTHYYLGLIWEKKGDAAKAAGHYREALTRALQGRPL